ncbi:hypothetical protein [Azospirillum sp. Marseille-Q6669]
MGNGSSQRKTIWASTIGTAIEFYDFLIYGVASALIFNKLFFPVFDELVGTLFSFGSFAVGFLARPLGGVLFGHFGDRLGRKNMRNNMRPCPAEWCLRREAGPPERSP